MLFVKSAHAFFYITTLCLCTEHCDVVVGQLWSFGLYCPLTVYMCMWSIGQMCHKMINPMLNRHRLY